MRIYKKKLLAALFMLSLTCPNGSTAFAEAPPSPPSPSSKPLNAAAASASPAASSPAPAQIQPTARLLLEQNKDPHRTFIHRTQQADCASKIDLKIVYFSPTRAFLVVDHCSDISPKTLRAENFSVAALDANLLKYDGKLLDPEEKADLTSYIFCEDGNDSAKRPLAMKIDVRLRDSALIAHLFTKGTNGVEDETLQVQAVPQKTKQTMLYTTGQPGSKPYVSFTVGNFQGLTGYLTYDIDSSNKAHAGVVGQNRKENNVNLARCFTP